MIVILKKPIYLSKLGIVFPNNVEMAVIVYNGVKFIQHPTIEGVVTELPNNLKTVDK